MFGLVLQCWYRSTVAFLWLVTSHYKRSDSPKGQALFLILGKYQAGLGWPFFGGFFVGISSHSFPIFEGNPERFLGRLWNGWHGGFIPTAVFVRTAD